MCYIASVLINPPKPTTSRKFLGYVVAYSFTYTMVLAPFLRKVPIKRYQHFSTATHTYDNLLSMDALYTL